MSVYHGKVHQNGPPAVRELTDLVLSKVCVGASGNNAYLLRCRQSGAQLLIDAAAEPARLLTLCGRQLDTVVTTHRHLDHWQALEAVVAETAAVTVAGREDADAITVPTRRRVAGGDRVTVGVVDLVVVHLPGHTPGSIALRYDDPHGAPHLWTGDSLFPGGVGRTTSPESFIQLLTAVKAELFDPLPDETWVYPGHGDDTVLGHERPHLDEWQARGW